MSQRKKIFAIVGSAGKDSANQKLVEIVARLTSAYFDITIYNELKQLPPFDPELSITNTPKVVEDFREAIKNADGILICTPEYIFSIPAGLKNAFEWCVSTVIFSDKPAGLITASASGKKAHEELQLIMQTVMAKFTNDTTLLISGIKGKINDKGELSDPSTHEELRHFITALRSLTENAAS